jgi:hypothetical protein
MFDGLSERSASLKFAGRGSLSLELRFSKRGAGRGSRPGRPISVVATSSRCGATGAHQMKNGFFERFSAATRSVVIFPVTSG